MKVVITGGAGMVGSHAAEFYAARGEDVVILDNLMRSKLFGYDKESVEYNWKYLKGKKNIKRVRGDVRNEKDLRKAITGDADVIIHTAGQPGVGLSIENPKEDYEINAFGTFNVLEFVRTVCPRAAVIYCSTNKVYGENVSSVQLIEDQARYRFKEIAAIDEQFKTDPTPHTPYGTSKFVGDVYTQEYGHTYGIKAGIFRMSCIYGTRQFGFEDQGWLAHFVISNVMNRPITIYGDGKQVRDVLCVEDLIDAFDRFVKSDLTTEVFNIGGGPEQTMSLLECIGLIEARTGRKMKMQFDTWRPSDQKVYISDIKKAKDLLCWAPKVSAQEGVGKVLAWVRDNKDLFE